MVRNHQEDPPAFSVLLVMLLMVHQPHLCISPGGWIYVVHSFIQPVLQAHSARART